MGGSVGRAWGKKRKESRVDATGVRVPLARGTGESETRRTLDKDKGGLLVLLINSLFNTTLLNLESVLLWRNLYSFTKSFR